MESEMPSKLTQVKCWFENPDKYLCRRQFDIRIRTETVQQFTKDHSFHHVLDIGCGDGSISLPLLSRSRKMTLLDVSTNMLAIARERIPPDRAEDVRLLNLAFLDSRLESESFDLILCIGVLAHVDSPRAVIAEIERIAKPGSQIVLEFTDRSHFWGLPDVIYQKALNILKPPSYSLNHLKNRDVIRYCREKGLTPATLYRYGLPPAGTHKVVNQDHMYCATRYLFGPSDANRNAWLGNEFIYCLQKEPTSS